MTPAEELRFHLADAHEALGQKDARVRFPRPQPFQTGPAAGHFHLRAELFLQRRAATRFRFAHEAFDLGPGEVLLVPARVHHGEAVVAGSSPFRNVVLYADETGLSCHLADQTPGGRPRIAYPENREGPGCSQVAAWLADADRIHTEYGETGGVVVDLVRSVLSMTLRLLDAPTAAGEPLLVVRCRRLIHEDLGDSELSVASLASRLGCRADYLSHLFRTVRGERLTQYIERLRMERAAELLLRSGLSCKEAAWASGYASQSYFIRCFRRRWGTSPGSYRQSVPFDRTLTKL